MLLRKGKELDEKSKGIVSNRTGFYWGNSKQSEKLKSCFMFASVPGARLFRTFEACNELKMRAYK